MNSVLVQEYTTALNHRRDIETRLSHLREDLKNRELYLTPTGEGYKSLGANDSDRKNVLEKSFLADSLCQQMRAQIREAEIKVSGVCAVIDAYEAERRHNEWAITRTLAQALERRYSLSNPGLDAAATAAVDQAVEAAAEVQAEEEDAAYFEWLNCKGSPAPEQEPIAEELF